MSKTTTSQTSTKADSVTEVADRVKEVAEEQQRAYAHGEDRPLKGYVVAMGTYGATVAALAIGARLAGRRLPDRIPAADFALMAVATHKITRIITKDAITSPLRAPFTEYKEPAGAGEVNEEVRADSEKKHAMGELLGCPFCLAVWTSTAFTAGYVFAPRQTRTVATTFSMVAVSDSLQFVYSWLKKIG